MALRQERVCSNRDVGRTRPVERIWVAQGILMERLQCNEEEAFCALQRRAEEHGRTLVDEAFAVTHAVGHRPARSTTQSRTTVVKPRVR